MNGYQTPDSRPAIQRSAAYIKKTAAPDFILPRVLCQDLTI